ncbi:Lrp/AsnC family transcriptional regulator [Geodermatophilus sp. SYSU D01186]
MSAGNGGPIGDERPAADPLPPRVPVLRAAPGGPELDDVERRLVLLLQEDGRTPYAELARRLGVTERTARRKVAGLQERGVLQIAAVTDPEVLGYASMALLWLTLGSGAATDDLAARVVALPEVDYVTVTTGAEAMQVEVLCRDSAALRVLVDEQFRSLPGVTGVDVLPYLRLHYQQARFDPDRLDIASGVRPTLMDAVDRSVVTQLAIDGRVPFSDVAARLGVSETMVRQRFQRLSHAGVVKVMSIANPLTLGYAASAWLAVRLAPGARRVDVAERLTALPAVSYVAITAGRCDVLAEVVCRHRDDLLALVDDQVRAIDGVGSVDVSVYLDVLYKPLLPYSPAP